MIIGLGLLGLLRLLLHVIFLLLYSIRIINRHCIIKYYGLHILSA